MSNDNGTRIILTINHEDYLLDTSVNLEDAMKILGKLTPIQTKIYNLIEGWQSKEYIQRSAVMETAVTVVAANAVVAKYQENTHLVKNRSN